MEVRACVLNGVGESDRECDVPYSGVGRPAFLVQGRDARSDSVSVGPLAQVAKLEFASDRQCSIESLGKQITAISILFIQEKTWSHGGDATEGAQKQQQMQKRGRLLRELLKFMAGSSYSTAASQWA